MEKAALTCEAIFRSTYWVQCMRDCLDKGDGVVLARDVCDRELNERVRSGASAAPDGGSTADSGEDNGGRPDAEHITPAKQLAEKRWTKYLVTGKAPTPAEDLQDYLNVAGPALGIDPMDRARIIREAKMRQAEEAIQMVPVANINGEDLFLKDIPQYLKKLTTDHTPFLDLINREPIQMAADGRVLTDPTEIPTTGEWYVEPAALLPKGGIWRGSGRKKRKVAEAEAQRRANETGVPWRVVRWYGEVGPTLKGLDAYQTNPDRYYYQSVWDAAVYMTFGGVRSRRKRDERMGSKRCRITRTFFPETLTGS